MSSFSFQQLVYSVPNNSSRHTSGRTVFAIVQVQDTYYSDWDFVALACQLAIFVSNSKFCTNNQKQAVESYH